MLLFKINFQVEEYVKELNSLDSRRGRKSLDVNNVIYWFKNTRAAVKRQEVKIRQLQETLGLPQQQQQQQQQQQSNKSLVMPPSAPQPQSQPPSAIYPSWSSWMAAAANFAKMATPPPITPNAATKRGLEDRDASSSLEKGNDPVLIADGGRDKREGEKEGEEEVVKLVDEEEEGMRPPSPKMARKSSVEEREEEEDDDIVDVSAIKEDEGRQNDPIFDEAENPSRSPSPTPPPPPPPLTSFAGRNIKDLQSGLGASNLDVIGDAKVKPEETPAVFPPSFLYSAAAAAAAAAAASGTHPLLNPAAYLTQYMAPFLQKQVCYQIINMRYLYSYFIFYRQMTCLSRRPPPRPPPPLHLLCCAHQTALHFSPPLLS